LVHCPDDPEEMAEAYFRGRLSAAECDAFEAHSRDCRKCTQALCDEALIVAMMRSIKTTGAGADGR
jgi:hypothetical protein